MNKKMIVIEIIFLFLTLRNILKIKKAINNCIIYTYLPVIKMKFGKKIYKFITSAIKKKDIFSGFDNCSKLK